MDAVAIDRFANVAQLAEKAGRDGFSVGDAMPDKIDPWVEAGATWWIEKPGGESEARILTRIRQGLPQLE